jgi:glycerate dehydrogenase
MNIVVLDGHALNPGDNPWEEIAALGNLFVHPRTEPGLVAERAGSAEIILTNKVPFTAERLRALPRMKLICVTASGYNIVDVDAAKKHGVSVCNVPEYCTDSVAQHVFALLLALSSRVGLHDEAVKSGEWSASPDFSFWKTPLSELSGKTMGIVGFGRIGRRVGEIAHAMGMDVRASSRSRGASPSYRPFACMPLAELFRASDVVSLHCPLTAENAGFVDRGLLAAMKPSAYLINTARGGLVQEADLADALNAGTIAGAGVDVVSVEPIRRDNPLLSARNIVITPHIAWASLESRRRLMHLTAENIRAFIAGAPVNVVG